MSDFSYRVVCAIGTPAFWVSASPVLLHRDRVPRSGAAILASTHLSHYDVPVLMKDTPRNIDFMSVAEFLKVPFVGKLFTEMNCFFLDRSRSDPRTVRTALDRLKQGRLVGMFPEGYIREWEDSVVHGKPFKNGVARLAYLSGAPVIPCVVLGTIAYKRVTAWLPMRRVRYGIIYGEPLSARTDLEEQASVKDLMQRLSAAYQALYAELQSAM